MERNTMQYKQPSISLTCIDALALATQMMLLEIMGISSERGVMTRRREFHPSDEVVVVISLTGAFEGVFSLCVAKHIAFKIASKMMGTTSNTCAEEIMTSAMAEFCNMTAGHALISMEYNGLAGVDISTPTILLRSPEQLLSNEKTETATIIINTPLGPIEIGLST